MKLLKEQINVIRLNKAPDILHRDMQRCCEAVAEVQWRQDLAEHNREVDRLVGLEQVHHRNELERIFNELERVIGFSVNKNDTPDTWDEWQLFKKKELEK